MNKIGFDFIHYAVQGQFVDMLKTPQFWLMWFMFSFAATAGLMTLGILKSYLQVANTGIDDVMAASIVGVVAIFNAI